MSNTSKKNPTNIDANNVLRYSYNVEDKTMGVNGFIVGKVGRKVLREIKTTNVPDDTESYTFSEDGVVLYVIDIVYTDSTLSNMLSVERVL